MMEFDSNKEYTLDEVHDILMEYHQAKMEWERNMKSHWFTKIVFYFFKYYYELKEKINARHTEPR